jgi:4-amino-4-deoxy-L-arabinose transferase-like glycosyltransferase
MSVSRDWWFGALVGKTISAAFAPLAALGLFAAGRRLFSSTAGELAALVYLSIPWVVQGATLGLVEAGTGCYLLATLLTASRLSETEKSVHPKSTAEKLPSVSHRAGWTLLAGFLAGGAMATKYPAAVFVVLPVGAWVAWTSRRKRHARETVIALALYAIAVAVGGGLWLAKNWALTGNPVYPLAYDWFDGTTRTAELNAKWQQAHRPPNFEPADLWRRIAGFVLTSEWLSPLVWPLAALGVLLGWRDRRVKWWFGYVALFFALWWLLTHRIDRFWVPVLPIMALVAGGAASSMTTTTWRRGLLALVGAGTLWSFVVVTSGIGGGDSRYFESLDRLKVDPSRLSSWQAWLNTHTPADKSVLSVGDAQVFDLEVPVLYNTVFDPSEFEAIVRDEHGELRPAADIRERLRGVAYVYVNWGEIVRYRSPGNYGFSDFVQPAIFERLVDEGVLGPAVPEFADVPVQIFPVRP